MRKTHYINGLSAMPFIAAFAGVCGVIAGLVIGQFSHQSPHYFGAKLGAGIENGSVMLSARSSQDFRNDYYPYSRQSIHETASGDFLVATIARKRHDWQTASDMYMKLLSRDPGNQELIEKVMILSLGAGDYDQAMQAARDSRLSHQDFPLASLLLALEDLHSGRFEKGLSKMESKENDAQIRIIKPIIKAWAHAGEGRLEVKALLENPLYIYDAVAVASYLDRQERFEDMLKQALDQNGIVGYDLERIGDLFAQKDKREQAKLLYNAALHQQENHVDRLKRKLSAIENSQSIAKSDFIVSPASSAIEGLSQSLFDLSMLLFRQNADTLSRLYASMALYLNKDLMEAKLLMAHIMAYKGQVKQALDQYMSVPEESTSYFEAQRKAAMLLEDAGQVKQALDILRNLDDNNLDFKTQLVVANIHRRQENYSKALEAYNTLFKALKSSEHTTEDKIREWNLYYLRGMTYERLGKFDKARRDLEKALKLSPSNPYILNYLGYSLADRGRDLEQALEYIQKAVQLAPDDGYIADSLGWVLYRMGHIERAIPHLEKAVELLPYDAIVNDHLGDAYWLAGRKNEARYQWKRALNHTQDKDMLASISQKMQLGIQNVPNLQSARKAGSDIETNISERKKALP